MGIIEVDEKEKQIFILSDIFIYGNEANEQVANLMEKELNMMWNEPRALVWMNQMPYLVNFEMKLFVNRNLSPQEINGNRNPRNNYFRIEKEVFGNISFVDGLGCNTGYFKLENLYEGSTTAAHEFGHTLGLDHPQILDYRGRGVPGIMYPRGTLVDSKFQYDENAKAGENGGTLYPIHRKVKQEDIDLLYLGNAIRQRKFVLGNFSSVYHQVHN